MLIHVIEVVVLLVGYLLPSPISFKLGIMQEDNKKMDPIDFGTSVIMLICMLHNYYFRKFTLNIAIDTIKPDTPSLTHSA